MKSLRSRLVMVMTAGALVVLPSANPRATRRVDPRGAPDPKTLYSKSAREYWLSADEFEYIRPGLKITVNSITNVGPGQKPVVDVTMTDDLDQPLDRKGILTPGEVGMEFIVARYNPDTRDYFNYTAVSFGGLTFPLHDVGGTWTDLDLGHSKYSFGLAMPADFDVTQTATLGIYADRKVEQIGKDYDAPAVIEYFRPDGGTPSNAQFDALDISACNTCHNPLSMHEQFGPPIQDVKLCVMCHTPEMPATQTGESLNFKVFIHKIHRGESLPSVEAGTPYVLGSDADFSTVALPQDIRNCQTCHSPVATGYTSWYTFPSRAACGSCHDDVNFATGENHPAGAYADDSLCATCHQPVGGAEWDASVQGAHTVPTKSSQLRGLNATIVSVTNTAPGQKPTVVFQITNGDGSAVDPSTLGNAFVVLSGPTTDYATVPFSFFESVKTATFDGQRATYTTTNAIPADATGTWAVAISALRSVTLNPAPSDGPTVREAALNPVAYVAVTDSQPVPRRQAVDRANCNKCHDDLALHGRNFLNTELCVMCHNPKGDDSSQRPADQAPPESVDFKRMIHRIHTGEELTHDYTIYGFGGSVHNFNEVRFPGDRRDCEKCHVPDAQQVPEDEALATRIPTITLRDWYSPMQPVAAACLGCHDEKHVAAHAFVMTAPFGEACMACHAPDAEFAVDKVHAR